MIQWDEVLCQHRNGMISGYRVTSSGINASTSDREFAADGLLPRKKYTFNVEALSTSFGNGPPHFIPVETLALQGELYAYTTS